MDWGDNPSVVWDLTITSQSGYGIYSYIFAEYEKEKFMIVPAEERVMTPKKPIIKVCTNEPDLPFEIQGDMYSIDNSLMVPSELYYRLYYLNGEIYETKYDMPVRWNGMNPVLGVRYFSGPKNTVLDPSMFYGVLGHINPDGTETESEPAYLQEGGIGGTAADAYIEEQPVYDLTGRRVNRDNLAPGIYISAGRKFIVK